MNYTTAIFLISDTVRGVKCAYEAKDNAILTTFKTFDRTIMPGDLVIVPTNTRHKRTCVKVIEVDVEVDFEDQTEMSWIVAKLDQAAYQSLLAQEGEMIAKMKSAQRTKQRRELAATMLADTEELQSLAIASFGVEPPAQSS